VKHKLAKYHSDKPEEEKWVLQRKLRCDEYLPLKFIIERCRNFNFGVHLAFIN
jgi:hypothetical protein